MERDSTEDIVVRCIERWRSSLDSLRSEHPEQARVLDRLLGGVERSHERELDWQQTLSIGESLRERVGKDVDPGIRLVQDEPQNSTIGSELLRAMRERGPTSRRYEVKEEIGRGGMGAVLRVYDKELHRHLAMKVLLDGRGTVLCVDSKGDTQRLARFLEEAQVTAQLDHPGIVPVHELGIDDRGRIYFTMKLVKGETLTDVFHRVEAKVDGWSRTRVLWTLLRVCEAMEFAHRRHVVHRDLKPSNIMVGEFGEAYVMDFGLARVLDRERSAAVAERGRSGDSGILERHVFTERGARASAPDSPDVTNSGDRLGTPAYMAPEQARGEVESIGPHTDVYALGAILYQLLAGKAPYLEEGRPSPISIITRVQREPPLPLHGLSRKIDGELQSICEKAMARGIADRYPSMAELAGDLRAYLENRVVSAHRSGAFVDLRKWVKRNRGTAYATLAAATIAIFALAAVLALKVVSESDLAKSNARVLERQLELDEMQVRLGDTKRQQDESKRDLAAKNLELDSIQRTLEESKATLGAQQIEIDLAKSNLEQRNAEAERLANGLAELQRDIDAKNSELNEATADLARERTAIAAMVAERDASKREEQRVIGELAAIQAELEKLERDRTRLSTEVQPLADLSLLAALESDEPFLWPARPETIPALNSWLERAQDLLREIASRMSARPVADLSADSSAVVLRDVAARTANVRNVLFPRVEARLAWARRVREITIDNHRDEWDAAIRSIADRAECPAYGGRLIEPIEGLVPLGRSAASGLHEFWHAESGDSPAPASNGEWEVAPATGIVLVLVPGGVFDMGARELDFLALPDARGRREEQPAHAIALEPFFISKYELTQGQWERCGGAVSTVRYRAGERVGGRAITGSNPVESISWDDARTILARVQLELPTEAQWEYAARGGTETPWWTGLEARFAWLAGNVADEYARLHGGDDWDIDRSLDDGHFVHASVGSFRANPLGLCDVIGNVAEWCLDEFGAYSDRIAVGVNGVHTYREFDGRVARGGSFRDSISDARSSARSSLDPDARSDRIGVRPVLRLAVGGAR